MIQAVLFDLDGTLADTAADLGAALNRLLAEEGQPPQPYDAIRPVASHGARGLIRLGFGIDRDHPRFDEYRHRFLEHYEAGFAEHTRLFDGVNELLQALSQRGIAWGIVTNKPARFTDRLVPALPFATPPRAIVSGDTTAAPKPDPRPMLHAAELMGIAPEHCVYVGDAERDIQAGHAVGMRTVLAEWGYIAADDAPHDWGADLAIAQPTDLLAHLD